MDTLSRRELFKKYSYGLVNTDDIDELQNIFDYAAGIIVKDADMADKYETTVSARNGNTYVKACYKMDDYNETQREKLKGMYEESNQYYRWLLDEYNIDPLTSRTAEDYDILKSISDTNSNGEALLTEYQEELFLKCYREALHYWNNVTRTKSFKNEEMYRQFSEVYLLFMAIQRYITYRMKSQFDVDTFNKFQCKNYFISNGVDYFDSLPLNYQRRLIKLLNDMQRDKGDDTVFNYIKDVLMVNNLDIYKYVLAKHQPTKNSKGDLVFYKVPYDEELNTDKNEVYSFESITEDDPYWRASKDEVLYQTFNTLDTKYISIEYVVDMIKNGKALSYFMYLLNDSMLKDIEAGDKTSLRFFDKNISSNPIKLYDAMMALYSLFYTYIKNDHFDDEPADKIDQDGDGVITNMGKPLIVDIHGYSSYENNLSIKETIDNIIYEIDNENNENNTPQSVITWNNDLKDFLTVRFNLRDFYYSDNFSFEAIENFYNNPSYKKYIGNTVENVKLGSMTIKSEFLELARYINAVGYYNTRKYRSYNQSLNEFDLYKNVLNDNLKESLAYVWDLIKNQCLPLSALNIHANFKKLFKKYIAYLIINGDISSSETVGSFYTMNDFYNDHFDIFYNLMIADQNETDKQNPILTELIDYVHEVWGYENAYFDAFLEQYNTQEGFKNFIKFINLVQHSFFTRDELYKYSNLLVFLEIFTSLKKEIYTKNANIDQEITGLTNIASKYSDIKIEEFMQVLNKNEAVRAELEKYIRESNNRKIYNGLRKLWLLKFKSNFNFEIYNEFETFKEYLLTNDDELYNFVTKFGDDFPTDSDRRKEIENRILELCTSIEKFIKSNGGIVYNSTFNVIFSNIKDYAILLIEVFKAYTLDTIYSGNILDFNDSTNERVKIWDEGSSDDEPFIEDLTFEASPEYLDLQDDIRKDNGDMDISYNLLVRSLVRNSLNVDSESEEDQDKYDKYLKYIKVEFKFLEAQYDLPYGVTSLTPEEFEAKYDDYFKSGKLGFGKRQYKYVTESYDFYHNNPNVKPRTFDPTTQLSSVELHRVLSDNVTEFIYTHIVTTTEALKNRDPSIVDKINDNRTFIDLTNKKIYCNTNDNKLSSLFGNTRDTYTNLYCFDYTSRNADTDNKKYIAYIALDETDNNYYTYVYDYDNDRFNKRCIIANITDYSGITPYIATHEIEKETDVEMPIYYDPNVYGACVYGRYIIHPLPNIFSDYPSDFNVANVSYNNINQYSDFSIFTYNDDFFYKYFNTSGRNNSDTRREKLFYIRPSRDYSWYIGNPDRIPFNKRIHPSLITIPNENYLNFLNTNNLVNSDNIYMIEYIPPEEPDDYTGPFYYLPEEIEENDEIKYILNKENRKTNIDDLHFVIKGNEVKNIELDLGKEYYCYASYTFSDLYKMYEKIEEDTIQDPENYKMYPMLTMYLKLNHEMTTEERERINGQLNIVDIELINSSNYLYKVKGNTKGKSNTSSIVDITKMNKILNFFNNVGHSMEDVNNTGFDLNYPFDHIESLLDEVIKHQFFFIKNEEDGLCTLLKYCHEYSNISPKGFYEIGYGYNFNSGSKIKILFEPLRYYNFSEFRDKLIESDPSLDPSNPDELSYYRDQSTLDKEIIPYYIDIEDQSTILDPEPYLCKKDKDTDLISYPVIGDNYLRALHQNYSNYRASSETNNLTGQFIRYDITENKGQVTGGNDNLIDYFKSIKCDGLADVSVAGVYNFYYYYDKTRGEDLPPQDLNGLSIGGYGYWLNTIDNALNGIKLKTPPTINDNAWLLTFFTSIEKPNNESTLEFDISDGVFGYIMVQNKGIVNPNDKTTYEYLNSVANTINQNNLDIWELTNDFNPLSENPSEQDEDIYNVYTYNEQDSNILKSAKLINRVSNFAKNSGLTNISYNSLASNNGFYELDNCTYNLFRNKTLNGYIYDYSYAKSCDSEEKVLFQKVHTFDKDSKFSENIYKGYISVYDENGEILIDKEDIFNTTFINPTTGKSIFERNKVYTFVIINVFNGVTSTKGNFMACSVLDANKSSGVSIIKDPLTNKPHNRIGTIVTNDSYIYASGQEIQLKFTNKNPKLSFKINGLITYDEMLEYKFDNSSELKWLKLHEGVDIGYGAAPKLYTFIGANEDEYFMESASGFITHEFSNTGTYFVCVSNSSTSTSRGIGRACFYSNEYNVLSNYINNFNLTDIRIRIPVTSVFLNKKNNFDYYTDNLYNKYSDYKEYFDFENTPEEDKIYYIPLDSSNTIWVKDIENNTMTFTFGNNTITTKMYSDESTHTLVRRSDNNNCRYTIHIQSNKNLKSIILPSDIDHFYNDSFNTSNIENITIGCLVTTIDGGAFINSKLKELYFLNNDNEILCNSNRESGLLYISSGAFSYTLNFKNNLFKIKFPYNMYNFGWSAFEYSTFIGLDFTNCHCLSHIGTDCFRGEEYFGRRYIIENSTNKPVLINNIPVYEGEEEWKDYLNENDKLNENYHYSDFEYLELPYSNTYSYFRLYANAFISNTYLRRAFLGNAYLVGSTAFQDCSRLMYVDMPEIRYLGGHHRDDIGQVSEEKYNYYKRYLVNIYSDNNKQTLINKTYAYRILDRDDEDSGTFYYGGVSVHNTDSNAGTDKTHSFNITSQNITTTYWYDFELTNDNNIYYCTNRNYGIGRFYGTSSANNIFEDCYSLIDVKIGTTIKTIQSNCFRNAGLYCFVNIPNIENSLKYGYFNEDDTFEPLAINSGIEMENYTTKFNQTVNDLYKLKEYYIITEDSARNPMACESHLNLNNYTITDYFKITYSGNYEQWKIVKKKQDWNEVNCVNKLSKDNTYAIEVAKWSPNTIFDQLAKVSNENNYFIRQLEPYEAYISSIESYNNQNELEVYNLKTIYLGTWSSGTEEYKLQKMIQNTIDSTNQIDGYINDNIENKLIDFLDSVVIFKGKQNVTYDYDTEGLTSLERNRKITYKVNYSIQDSYKEKSLFIDPYYTRRLNTFENCSYNNYYMDKNIYEFSVYDMFNIAKGTLDQRYKDIFKFNIQRAESVNGNFIPNNNWSESISENNKFNRDNLYDPNNYPGTNYSNFLTEGTFSKMLDLTKNNDNLSDKEKKRLWITNTELRVSDTDVWEEQTVTPIWENPNDKVWGYGTDDPDILSAINEFGSYKDQFISSTSMENHASRIVGLRTTESNGYKKYDSLNVITNIYSITVDSNNNIIEFKINGFTENTILDQISITENDTTEFYNFDSDELTNLTYSDVFNILKNSTTINSDTAQTIFSNGIREFTNKTASGSNFIFT